MTFKDSEILNFHDFPGFPGPARTLYIPKRKKVTQDKMILSNDEYLIHSIFTTFALPIIHLVYSLQLCMSSGWLPFTGADSYPVAI